MPEGADTVGAGVESARPTDSRPQGEEPLTCQSDAFSLPSGLHFLNCAYMSPLPKETERAVTEGLARKRDPTGIRPPDFFEDAEEIRRRFASLVRGTPDEVAIMPSASYGVAVCARNLEVGKGQRIVLTHEQFPGNVYAWRRVAEEVGAEIVTVGPGEVGERPISEAWNDRLLEAIDRRTAVVTIPNVHWTDGTPFDVSSIAERTRDVGAALVIDATQSVGALPLDVGTVRPDAVVVAVYKWLFGPYGLALGWFGPRFEEGTPLEETWMGRRGSEDFQGLVDYEDRYQPGARRFDVGEVANFALLPGLKASLRLVLEWGPARIQRYCRSLMEPFVEAARGEGFRAESGDDRPWHIVGIRMRPGVELDRIKAELDARRVVVSLRGDALRVSCNAYNDPDDIGALMEVLRAV